MTGLLADELIPLDEVAARVPRAPGQAPVNRATVWRWRTRGIRGVRLQTTHIGTRAYVTQGDLTRFIEAVQATHRDGD